MVRGKRGWLGEMGSGEGKVTLEEESIEKRQSRATEWKRRGGAESERAIAGQDAPKKVRETADVASFSSVRCKAGCGATREKRHCGINAYLVSGLGGRSWLGQLYRRFDSWADQLKIRGLPLHAMAISEFALASVHAPAYREGTRVTRGWLHVTGSRGLSKTWEVEGGEVLN